MDQPLMATKLYVPVPPRGLVARPRLFEKLVHTEGAALTLVSAPAGFGKTALLADWLADTTEQQRNVAWLSLEPADSDPATFWAYVIAAFRKTLPGIGTAAQELVASPPLATELVLTVLLNDLAAAAHDTWLVLDDYHAVDSPAIADGIAYFLKHHPPNVHVVVSTRSDPGLPLSRWRSRGELLEIRAADLRFTRDEAAAYLNGAAGLGLADAQVSTLEQRTEGWIAALQLAALSIRDRPDPAGFIEGFAGDDRYVVDYLVDEVLRHQTDNVRSFLERTAVLDRLTGPLCDAVAGTQDGGRMLADLERANLFVIPLDDRRDWYRYHHLFADVLRNRLLRDDPGRVPVLHRRASRWHASHGGTADAVRHALAGQDNEFAALLVEQAVPLLRRNRQDTVLFAWLRKLPDGSIRRSPVLTVFYGAMLMAEGDLRGVEQRLADAEEMLAAAAAVRPENPDMPPDPENLELQALPATIATYRAALALARGDTAGAAAYAREALERGRPEDHLSRGAAAGFLGLAAWAAGTVDEAQQIFTEAIASLHAGGNLLDGFGSTVILADILLTAGRPGEARRICNVALQAAADHGESLVRASAELHVALSEMSRQAGEPAAAKSHLDAAAEFVERGPMTESRYRWFLAAGLLAQDAGDAGRAVSCLDRAEQLYRPGFFPEVRPVPAVRARLWIRQGNLAAAGAWARALGITAHDDLGYLGEYNQLTLVRLMIAEQPADPAAALDAPDLLGRLATNAAASGRAGSLMEIRMLQALALALLGRRAQAQEALREALTASPEPEAYVRLFLDEGEPLQALLRETVRSGDGTHHGAAATARHLLGLAAPSGEEPARLGEEPPAVIDPLSERELQVLRLLGTELSGPEIARALFISQNTLRTHTKHIFTKLGVTSRRSAVALARRHGLA